jgi:hypothetical protein
MSLLSETRISTRCRCERSVGDKAPETLPFSMEFVPEGEPRVASGGVREEVWPSTDGGGGLELAPERQLFWAWRLKKQICYVGRRNNKVALWMYYLNFKSANHHILVQCDKHIKSNNPAYTCTSLRLRQHASIKVVCRVTATPVGQTLNNMFPRNPRNHPPICPTRTMHIHWNQQKILYRSKLRESEQG